MCRALPGFSSSWRYWATKRRSTLQGVDSPQVFAQREAQLRAELNRQPDLALRITAQGQLWFDGAPGVNLPTAPGLHSLQNAGTDYRVYNAPLRASQADSPQLTLVLDITHHQHFLQRRQKPRSLAPTAKTQACFTLKQTAGEVSFKGFDMPAHSALGNRQLFSRGSVYNRAGQLVASVTQEGLIRHRKDWA